MTTVTVSRAADNVVAAFWIAPKVQIQNNLSPSVLFLGRGPIVVVWDPSHVWLASYSSCQEREDEEIQELYTAVLAVDHF